MDLYDYDVKLADLDIEVPAWIDQDITAADIAAIVEGGCASGAYMPAVRYYDAARTMSEHGDDVLDYIKESGLDLPNISEESWRGIAVAFLSCAVELWASSVEEEIVEAIGDMESEEG